MWKWWQAIETWLPGPDVSHLTIPFDDDPVEAVRKIRRGLRDVRDRIGRERNPAWRQVAFGGFLNGATVLVRVHHPGIHSVRLWPTLKTRWPEIVVRDVSAVCLDPNVSIDVAADLARRRRGIEPIRIIVPSQVQRKNFQDDAHVEPMPFLF